MTNKSIPPNIEPAQTVIGIGFREILVFSIGLVIAGFSFIYVKVFPIKIGLAVLSLLSFSVLAIGRDPETRLPYETVLFQKIRRHARPSNFRSGVADETFQEFNFVESTVTQNEIKKSKTSMVKVKPINITPTIIFQIVSYSFLAMLLAYIFNGGLAELYYQFKSPF